MRRQISSPARRGLRATPVALAASIYLLSGKEALLRAARACLHAALPPRAAGSVLEICRLANKIFSGYIGGQLVDALLVGGETFALMSIFGLEYAPLLSVLVGVTNIVPVLGPFLGAVPGLIILLLELPWKAAEFAIIIFVVQQVDGNFIAPRILGGATGLPGRAVGHRGGRGVVRHPGHGAGRADAGRAGGAAQTGCRGRADGPRPG